MSKPTLRRDGINVRLDRETHQKITRIAALLTLRAGRRVQLAAAVRAAIEAFAAGVERG